MKQPWVTFILVLICVGLFFLPDETKSSLLTNPHQIVHEPSIKVFGKAALSGFLHRELWHLLGNITWIIFLGYCVENYTGHLKYATLLLASGVFALALHVGVQPNKTQNFLGASGFLYGLAAAYAKILKKNNQPNPCAGSAADRV